VVRSLKLDTESVRRFIDKSFPWFARFILKQGWGIEGTFVHWLFTNRFLVYRTYVLKKKVVL